MAIVSRKVCKCAICGWEWLASKSNRNPAADPRKVQRCSSCKSFAWNADDPKVIEAKLAKIPMPEVPKEVIEYPERLMELAQVVTGAQPVVATCRHRVLLSACPLCRTEVFK